MAETLYRNVECAWSCPRGRPAGCSETAQRHGPRHCCGSLAPSRHSPGPVPGPSVAAAPNTAFKHSFNVMVNAEL